MIAILIIIHVDGPLPQDSPRQARDPGRPVPSPIPQVERALALKHVPTVREVAAVLKVAPAVLGAAHDPRDVPGAAILLPRGRREALPVGGGHGRTGVARRGARARAFVVPGVPGAALVPVRARRHPSSMPQPSTPRRPHPSPQGRQAPQHALPPPFPSPRQPSLS